MSAPIEPDDAEIMQVEAEGPIHVTIDGPVRTVELPAKSSGMRVYDLPSDAIAGAEPIRLLGRDPRRKSVLFKIVSGNIKMGVTKNEAGGAYAAEFLSGDLFTLVSTDEIWMLGLGAVARVTVVNQAFAD